MDPILAVGYVPWALGMRNDCTYAKECVAHIERHGYGHVATLRDWEHVVTVMGRGNISVVVFALREHRDRNAWAGWRARHEFVGEDTRELAWPAHHRSAVNRGTAETPITKEVDAYRNGYADGFIDSTTLRSTRRQRRRS